MCTAHRNKKGPPQIQEGDFSGGRNGGCKRAVVTPRQVGDSHKGVSLLCILICMSESGLSQGSLEGPNSFHIQLRGPFSQDPSLLPPTMISSGLLYTELRAGFKGRISDG